MMSLTFGLFTQVSGSGPLGPLVLIVAMCNNNDQTWVPLSIKANVSLKDYFEADFGGHKCCQPMSYMFTRR